MEMTEGPFAYCENCTARRAGGGNNMSFSRALSGGTEMQVSASLSAAGAGGGRCSSRYFPVPEPRGKLPPPLAHHPVPTVRQLSHRRAWGQWDC